MRSEVRDQTYWKSGRFGYPILNLPDLENYLELGVHVQTATAPRCVLFIFELTSGPSTLGVVGLPPHPPPTLQPDILQPYRLKHLASTSWLFSLSPDCIEQVLIKQPHFCVLIRSFYKLELYNPFGPTLCYHSVVIIYSNTQPADDITAGFNFDHPFVVSLHWKPVINTIK